MTLGCSVREAQARISSREFGEWMALYRVEPWGDLRGDVQAAVVASTMANAYRDRKKRRKPFAVKEFLPFEGAWEKVAEQAEGETERKGAEAQSRRGAGRAPRLTQEEKRSLWRKLRGWAAK